MSEKVPILHKQFFSTKTDLSNYPNERIFVNRNLSIVKYGKVNCWLLIYISKVSPISGSLRDFPSEMK